MLVVSSGEEQRARGASRADAGNAHVHVHVLEEQVALMQAKARLGAGLMQAIARVRVGVGRRKWS